MSRNTRLGLIFLGFLATLGGCRSRDPYARDDVWYPSGSNAANLAAQVANPADLATGRGDPQALSAAQVKALGNLAVDMPKKLEGGTTSGQAGGGQAGGS